MTFLSIVFCLLFDLCVYVSLPWIWSFWLCIANDITFLQTLPSISRKHWQQERIWTKDRDKISQKNRNTFRITFHLYCVYSHYNCPLENFPWKLKAGSKYKYIWSHYGLVFFGMELVDIECHEINSINTRFFPENIQANQISDLNGKADIFFSFFLFWYYSYGRITILIGSRYILRCLFYNLRILELFAKKKIFNSYTIDLKTTVISGTLQTLLIFNFQRDIILYNLICYDHHHKKKHITMNKSLINIKMIKVRIKLMKP